MRVAPRESGVLPLPLRKGAPDPAATAPIRIGYRGSFFHPVTGYSLPLAVRVAQAVAARGGARARCGPHWRIASRSTPQRGFGRLLNRLMFDAMPPADRWTALDRFYRMPAPTIARFYASRTTAFDRARLLLGRPPAGVSWRRADRIRARRHEHGCAHRRRRRSAACRAGRRRARARRAAAAGAPRRLAAAARGRRPPG